MASKPAPKKAPPKATKPAARKKAVGAAVSAPKNVAASAKLQSAARIIDWERIELDYRAGIKTLRQIADEHGISHVAVAKRAKRDGWTRDLAGKIQAKADELVNKSLVTSAVTAETKIAEKAVIDANAQAVADIRLAHRSDIRRARNLTNSLLAELEAQTDPSTLAMLHELGEMLRNEDDNGQDRRNDLYTKVISLSERSKTMKTLADSLRVVVDMERTAFSMDKDQGPAADPLTSLLKTITSGTGSTFKPVAHDPDHDED